uniref:ABC transporter domain-containing protein n=1 Tax=Photinus pyralis TaxID=7054 RepID=A0A1Y1M3W5_PHOPY
MNLMAQLTVAVKNITDIENHMISVERILEYDYIGQEGQESSRNMLPVTWPSSGEIRFEKVNVKYGKTDPNVLKDLTFSVEPLLKIGIVGRTGAGKSSLINALFQLVHTEGKILIDNINISTIGLHDLRKSISIIPQNPVVFSGTLRYNLDPANEYQDETLWKALEEVGLKTFVQNLRLEISQTSSNFSLGQLQLICLARALLRNNKILILDEATANVDLETDEIIQKTIRRIFSNCTVLTIAHRLNTVMDSDKILVIDSGVAVEYDHPHLLLQNQKGTFYGMVQQTESAMIETLKNVALEVTNTI